MKITNMFKKTTKHNETIKTREGATIRKEEKPEVPQGLMRKCNMCKKTIFTEEVIRHAYVCPECGGYFRMHARTRVEMVIDEDTFEEWNQELETTNPLQYAGYERKIEELRIKTGLDEAVITGVGKLCGQKVVVGVMDGRFMMASMGSVVGEKITRAIEEATKLQVPIILFACSGGARMQEGITSLMQMAKTSAALKRHSDAGQLYISVLTDPTTGGVTASFAMLGDIILAEPNALIGFAGPRVIEQTIGAKLPKGFQRSEFLLEHGYIDAIVKRNEMKETLSQIVKLHQHKKTEYSCENRQNAPKAECISENLQNAHKAVIEQEKFKQGNMNHQMSPWERVLLSRKKERPVGTQYIEELFQEFIELHGDRSFGDDKAIVGGIAQFNGIPVTVIVQAKGEDTKGNIERNFGMPSPEGYRKALRLMRQAEKFKRPIICFVDTPGAFCGIEAEERGQGEAIAQNLYQMSTLKVPILSIVIGEGGSGGALAMALANEVWMLENAVYSILSPEGYAAILWKDSSRAKEAASIMKMTSYDLKEAGMIEQIIPEPLHYTWGELPKVCLHLHGEIMEFLEKYHVLTDEELVERRYQRFRRM